MKDTEELKQKVTADGVLETESSVKGEVITHILTREQQQALTPEKVLEEFKQGHQRFLKGNLTQRNHGEQVRASAPGQYPKAVVLSCLDSRVPVEDIFDQGIGDIFVGRIAGNFVNQDMIGSMEFACKLAGARLILVMGHQHCGAIKGAISEDEIPMGNLAAMLENIKPAVVASSDFDGEKSSENDEYVKYVSINNIKRAVDLIRKQSPTLKKMEEDGEIKIIGAFYLLTDAEIEFFENI